MAEVAVGALLLGTTISATSAISAGQANEEISKYNAKVNRLQAIDALQQGKKEVKLIRKQATELKGAQRASLAAQGIDVDSGTAALVQAETDYIAEIEVNTTLNNADRAAWGYEVGATQTLAQGQMAGRTGALNAAGSLFSGIGQTAVAGKQLGAF